DDLAFERIVNTPKRGLGDAAVQMIHQTARAEHVPLLNAAANLVTTEEMKPRPRKSLSGLVEMFERWRSLVDNIPHTELAEMVLDESGYTEMWQNDKSPDAPGRLDNLKELVRSMEAFENLGGFLEHIALVMDATDNDTEDMVSIMTLHGAKGLEFDCVFLPGWEEGLFPSQRTLDESGHAGLEEERRLAYVGLTRARKRAKVTFASNRRIHGLWQSSIPSRFVDELPEAEVDVIESSGYGGLGGYGASRFDQVERTFDSSYTTPGWQRAQSRGAADRWASPSRAGRRSGGGPVIDGELIASSVGDSGYDRGDRVFHQKFGYGDVEGTDGNKLTVQFDKAGRKRVLATFVERQ
ncbi:MAG: 3'-5' exonuclease, partial [Pseudomonadota bacterium]